MVASCRDWTVASRRNRGYAGGMASHSPDRARLPLPPPSGALLWAGGALLLWVLYALVFVQTTPVGWLAAALDAAANVLPLAILAAATHALLKDRVMSLPVARQAAAHVALAPVFALTWYALVVVLLGFSGGLRGHGFTLYGFSGPALPWQTFQGLILYATIAATCYAIRGARVAVPLTIVETAAPLRAADRYLVRTGDTIAPLRIDEIVTINGAQDYAEITTDGGARHLVRVSLAEFEARLDPQRFLRVHRSAIVNLDHLARAEPAGGGRMLLHMANGESLAASRTGVQALRRFIV